MCERTLATTAPPTFNNAEYNWFQQLLGKQRRSCINEGRFLYNILYYIGTCYVTCLYIYILPTTYINGYIDRYVQAHHTLLPKKKN